MQKLYNLYRKDEGEAPFLMGHFTSEAAADLALWWSRHRYKQRESYLSRHPDFPFRSYPNRQFYIQTSSITDLAHVKDVSNIEPSVGDAKKYVYFKSK